MMMMRSTLRLRRFFTTTKATTTRPFRILGVQQIAIGSETREPLACLWGDIFGLKKHGASKTIEKENVQEDIIKLGPAPYEVEIDLMTPIDPEKSPKVRFGDFLCSLLRSLFDWCCGLTQHHVAFDTGRSTSRH